MDEVLQGTKGEISYYTDNVGKVTDTVSKKDPGAGNDVYLTIDKDLQEQTYKTAGGKAGRNRKVKTS